MFAEILKLVCFEKRLVQGSQHSGKIREKLEKLKKSGKTWKTQGTLSENQRHQGKLGNFIEIRFIFKLYILYIFIFCMPTCCYRFASFQLKGNNTKK